MLWTLQKYIFREMGKTFLLTSIGLIVIIGLGGGVKNMIELEGINALQLLKIMGLVLPVAASLTLPIAALYSATVTYGRLSADNELVACRSGGINLHVLFLPTIVISLVSAIITFFCINFIIPSMVMNLENFMKDDLASLAKHRLSTPDRLPLGEGRYRIYADGTEAVRAPNDEPDKAPTRLKLTGVAFLEMDGNEWTRFGTTESIQIEFDTSEQRNTITAEMNGLSLYDAKTGRYSDFEHESIGKFPIPGGLPLKVAWLDLGGLLRYRSQPSLWPKIDKDVALLRLIVAQADFYRDLNEQFRETGQVVFGDNKVRYTITANTVIPDLEDNCPRYEGDVTITETRHDGVRKATADWAMLKVSHSASKNSVQVYIEANDNVRIVNSRNPDMVISRTRERFEPADIPEVMLQKALAEPTKKLLENNGRTLGRGTLADKQRDKVVYAVSKLSRKITGVLHSRLAFSISVFVLVIMGAALGIVFRGSQVLVAFGISFIPSLFVITTIIMGKQLIDKPNTVAVGVMVIWLGIIVMGIIDTYVLCKVVRR